MSLLVTHWWVTRSSFDPKLLKSAKIRLKKSNFGVFVKTTSGNFKITSSAAKIVKENGLNKANILFNTFNQVLVIFGKQNLFSI